MPTASATDDLAAMLSSRLTAQQATFESHIAELRSQLGRMQQDLLRLQNSQTIYLGDHEALTRLHTGHRIYVDTRDVGICSHLGCSPSEKMKIGPESGLGDDWPGGFYCPCHGSKFDLAGRVFKGMPAPVNLTVPPHTYVTDTRLLIGEDKKGA